MSYKPCEECVHWELATGTKVFGFCRRGPPTPIIENDSTANYQWPRTPKDETCGEHKHKDPSQRPQPDIHELMRILNDISQQYLDDVPTPKLTVASEAQPARCTGIVQLVSGDCVGCALPTGHTGFHQQEHNEQDSE